MQLSLTAILNISVEFHPGLFFFSQHELLHCLSEFNNDTTKRKKKKQQNKQKSLLNSLLKVIFYSTCQDYVAFQSMEVVLFILHFALLIFINKRTWIKHS